MEIDSTSNSIDLLQLFQCLKSADCLSELEKILPEMLDVLGPDELEKVRRNLVAVADKVEELIGEIDERA